MELALAVVAITLASVLCIWMIFFPAYAEPRPSQFFLCVVISIYLAIFFFILWPQPDLSAPVNIWFSAQPVRITGPIVLAFISLVLLYGMIPPSEYESLFPVEGPPERILFDPMDTKLEYRSGKPNEFSYRLISGSGLEHDVLKDIYIRFPSGENSVLLLFKHHGYEDFEFTLARHDKRINLSGLKRKKEE